MNNAELVERLSKYLTMIGKMAMRLEEHHLSWKDIAELNRKETEAVESFINDHLYYPGPVRYQ